MYFLYKGYVVEYEYFFNNLPKTLLLLHGWGGNKDSFAKVKKIFKSRFNILSVSLPPPHLYSSTPSDSILALSMYDYKDIVFNILKILNLNSVIIVCHSFGLRVSLMLSTTSINIEKIVITGGAGIRLKPNFFKKLNTQFKTILLKKHSEYFNKFASSEYVDLSYIDKQTFKNIVNKDLSQYIKNLTCPAFLFWGKKDKSTPIKMFKIFKKLKPNIEYKLIKNGTHFCYLDNSNLFIDCCDKFLNC